MKRILIYIIVTALALLVPEYGTDVGKLIPVELVFLYNDGEQIVIETDTEHIGKGVTVEEAVQNLSDTTPGVLFLDTADYLMVTEEAQTHLPELDLYLKGRVKVCLTEQGTDVKQAAQYLAIHQPGDTLKDAQITQKLIEREGRYLLT